MRHKLIISNGENSIDLYDDRYLLISAVEGVGVSANVNITEYGSSSGGSYNGTHVAARTISIAAKFRNLGDMSAQKMRIYDIFQVDKELNIRYVTPSIDVMAKGYCSKCDIPPNAFPLVFSAEIICPDPYFKKAYVAPVQLYGTAKMFSFKKGATEFNKVCFGNMTRAKVVRLDYEGSIRTGFVVRVALSAACSGFRIENYTLGCELSVTGSFLAGDIIEISTEDHRQYIDLYRGGTKMIGLKYLDEGSEFFQLIPGMNEMKFIGNGIDAAAADAMMYYDVKVGGV